MQDIKATFVRIRLFVAFGVGTAFGILIAQLIQLGVYILHNEFIPIPNFEELENQIEQPQPTGVLVLDRNTT